MCSVVFNYSQGVATLTVNSLSESGVILGSVLDIVQVARGVDKSSIHSVSALLSFGIIFVSGGFCCFEKDFWYAMLIALLNLGTLFSLRVFKEYSVSMYLLYLLSLIKWLREVYHVVLGSWGNDCK